MKVVNKLNAYWVVKMEPSLVALFDATYIAVAEAAPNYQHLYYVADAFDDVDTQIWTDTWGHVTPEGNAIISRLMRDVIIDGL